jgi:hypothetical protein
MDITTKKSTIAVDVTVASAKLANSSPRYLDGRVPDIKRKPHAIAAVIVPNITASYWCIMSTGTSTTVSYAI